MTPLLRSLALIPLSVLLMAAGTVETIHPDGISGTLLDDSRGSLVFNDAALPTKHIQVGDRVSYNLNCLGRQCTASDLVFLDRGTVISGLYEGDLMVSSGERVTLVGRVTGDVVVDGGALVVVGGQIDGDLLIGGGGTTVSDSATIGGNLRANDAEGVSLTGGSYGADVIIDADRLELDGHATVANDLDVVVESISQRGELEVGGRVDVAITTFGGVEIAFTGDLRAGGDVRIGVTGPISGGGPRGALGDRRIALAGSIESGGEVDVDVQAVTGGGADVTFTGDIRAPDGVRIGINGPSGAAGPHGAIGDRRIALAGRIDSDGQVDVDVQAVTGGGADIAFTGDIRASGDVRIGVTGPISGGGPRGALGDRRLEVAGNIDSGGDIELESIGGIYMTRGHTGATGLIQFMPRTSLQLSGSGTGTGIINSGESVDILGLVWQGSIEVHNRVRSCTQSGSHVSAGITGCDAPPHRSR